ncbi:MAG: helix-turn-helix transcriptional regulator [Clostridia bacterium]|nr:helix-turn-helix transcriptional regulator [Clostridia bacterium]
MKNSLGLVGLKLIRRHKKYSQLKVALDLNLSREALSHYENGKRSPDIEMLRKMSKYFGVSIDFLINGHEYGETSDTFN